MKRNMILIIIGLVILFFYLLFSGDFFQSETSREASRSFLKAIKYPGIIFLSYLYFSNKEEKKD